MPVLFGLQQIFSLWMLYDAVQRRAEPIWYLVILMPFGEVIYFFAVKYNDPDIQQLVRNLSSGRPKLSELRYNARMTPSAYNRARLARGLHDAQQYEEASDLFDELIREDPTDDKLRQDRGINALAMDDGARAIECLEPIVKRDLSFDSFSAAGDLATAYRKTGADDKAIALLREVLGKSRRIVHQVSLAELLIEKAETDEARTVLQTALDDFEHSPRYVQRSEHRWARRARKMLRQATAE